MSDALGNVTIRATSRDFIRWQVVEEDGTTVVPLDGSISVTLRLQDKLTGVVTEFSTTDASPKLFVVDSDNGEVELRPGAADFPSEASYRFTLIVNDSFGNHFVSERLNYTLNVIDEYAP